MAKLKMSKNHLDMTAICVMLHSLRSLFWPLQLDTRGVACWYSASTVKLKCETDIAIMTVDGKVFFDLKGREVRKVALRDGRKIWCCELLMKKREICFDGWFGVQFLI
jgi:hypothetical protein